MNKLIHGFIMKQMSANAGIRKHGKETNAAVMAKLEQLEVCEAINVKTLCKERAMNLFQEKKWNPQERTVVDGHPQESMYRKSQAESPTVFND
jgi:hypothetical protein